MLGTFFGSLAQTVDIANTLIACVPHTERVCGQSRAVCFEQRQIVDSSGAKGSRQDFSAGQVCQDLGFYRVTFLFPTVVISLLFLGRSIGDSLASTTTTSKTVFVSVRDFLPGRVNLPDCIRAFSTRLMVRQTVGSLIPKD